MTLTPKKLKLTKRSGTQEGTNADDFSGIASKVVSRLGSSEASIDTEPSLTKSETDADDFSGIASQVSRLGSSEASIDTEPSLSKSATDGDDSSGISRNESQLGSSEASIETQHGIGKLAIDGDDSCANHSKASRLGSSEARFETQPGLGKSATIGADSIGIPKNISRLGSSEASIEAEPSLSRSAADGDDSSGISRNESQLESSEASIETLTDLGKSATDGDDSCEILKNISRLGSSEASIEIQPGLGTSATIGDDSSGIPKNVSRLGVSEASIATQPGLGKLETNSDDSNGISRNVNRLGSSKASDGNTQPEFESRKRYVYAIGGIILQDSRFGLLVERYDIDNDHPRKVIDQSTSKVQAIKATSNDEIANPRISHRQRAQKYFALSERNQAWTRYDYYEENKTSMVPLRGMGVTLHKGIIWVAGGWPRRGKASAFVFTYDLKNRLWQQRVSMCQGRAQFGLIVFQEKLYAIGGVRSRKALKSMEVYKDDESKWELSHDMVRARYEFGTALWRDKIFVAGGRTKSSCFISDIECYDEKSWIVLDISRKYWQSSEICVVNDTLYAVSGDVVPSISYLVEESDKYTWAPLYEINHTEAPNRNISVVAIDGKIYLFGGSDKKNVFNTDTVFRFDPVTKCLERMESMYCRRISPGMIIMPQ